MGTRGGRPEPQAVAARRAGKGGRADAGISRGTSAARGAGTQAQRPRTPAPPRARDATEAAGPPLWFQLATLVLALVGLGVSVYLTIAHYTESALAACPETSTVNCAKVTTSPESMVFGIFPVAVLGLAFYVFMVAVTTPWAWRARPRADRGAGPAARLGGLAAASIGWARLAGVVAGMAFVLYLIYVELFLVNAICLWCTSVHVVTFLLFAFIVASAATWGIRRSAGAGE